MNANALIHNSQLKANTRVAGINNKKEHKNKQESPNMWPKL